MVGLTRRIAMAAVVAGVLGAAGGVEPGAPPSAPSNLGDLRLDRATPYGKVQVIDFSAAADDTEPLQQIRYLRCGESIVGAEWLSPEFEGQSAFLNFAIHQAVAFWNPTPKRVLQLGLGAGTVPKALRKAGIATDVVEINAAVVDAAIQFFGLPAGPGSIVVDDAAAFLRRTEAPSAMRYDAVLLDLFNGSNPACATSGSMLASIRDDWLSRTGVLLVNLFGFHSAGERGTHAGAFRVLVQAFAALRQTFGSVRCYREIPLELAPNEGSNIICVAAVAPGSVPRAPFAVPTTGDFADPIELSSFWIQRHFQDFEITSVLHTAMHGDLESGGVIVPDLVEAAAQINRGYRKLLVSLYPSAIAWDNAVRDEL